ncbi:uncharacterized protein EI90DRAFT_73411 [Cantharellus anzutake]|uniref:uncharacterized protein n=1 Tax=Cantharellus anzutake TaxID=1750568 RepID=UPI001908301D|nr:uncharacterized protein EI90DRAFT_73411 [Cantharellus anzutake]KAF8336810.1 hypothetical protein EI90DRAFT_73411 [Cantharellus anzutake]
MGASGNLQSSGTRSRLNPLDISNHFRSGEYSNGTRTQGNELAQPRRSVNTPQDSSMDCLARGSSLSATHNGVEMLIEPELGSTIRRSDGTEIDSGEGNPLQHPIPARFAAVLTAQFPQIRRIIIKTSNDDSCEPLDKLFGKMRIGSGAHDRDLCGVPDDMAGVPGACQGCDTSHLPTRFAGP